MTTWREILEEVWNNDGEMVCTLTDEELDKKFDAGFGGTEGEPFTAWGDKYVYFPIEYDGAESVGKAPRMPSNEKTDHQ